MNVVFDTNVLISAFRSRRGASFKLLTLIDKGHFRLNISPPLIFEYEAVLKRDRKNNGLSVLDIETILDYFCAVSRRSNIFYLWRPYLKDPKDDFLLELAVTSQCQWIVTHNLKDFSGCEYFGIQSIDPKSFLKKIGELA